jgi:RNA polymerase sigma-70 factor, ECF subfamily
MSDATDSDQLLANAMAGDRGALADLLERIGAELRPRIAGKISKRWNSVLDADDVMQVTYMEAILQIDRFSHGGVDGFRAWLTRLAEHNLIDAVRGLEAAKRPNPSRRVQARPSSESMSDLVAMLGATYTTPSRVAARGEANHFLDGALNKLPADYGRVIRMYDLEDKPIEEVAQELGRSAGAVYMLRARAHERLREAMGTAANYFSTPG